MTVSPLLRFRKFNVLASLCVALALASCSLLPPKESPDIYLLPGAASATASAASGHPLAWQLRVDTPNANSMIDGTGIVVLPQAGRITVYTNARWSEAAPVLVRQRLMDQFMATHRLSAVTDDDDHLAADFVLSGDLRAFQSEYRNGAPVVVVRYDAQLRRGGSRRVFATHSFEATANPSGVGVPQVADAFGQACDQLSAQVVAWTVAQAQQQWQAQPDMDKSPGD